MTVKPLTTEERENLEGQYDRVRMMLAELDAALVEADIRLAEAIAEQGAARVEVEQAKNEKSTIVERMRNLKALLLSMV